MFLGAKDKQIEGVLAQHKEQREQIKAIGLQHKSMTNGNSRSSELVTLPISGTPSGDTRTGLSADDNVMDHTRKLSNDGAQGKFEQDARSTIRTETTRRM